MRERAEFSQFLILGSRVYPSGIRDRQGAAIGMLTLSAGAGTPQKSPVEDYARNTWLYLRLAMVAS